jgi:predicted nucleotidyltransferase
VRGDWIEESDVDLVVVSNSFEGLAYMDRLELV